MILDWRKDPEHAKLHEILDAETGEPLPMTSPWSDIFYADDSRGLLKVVKLNESGHVYFEPENSREVAWKYIHHPIRIVPKDEVSR